MSDEPGEHLDGVDGAIVAPILVFPLSRVADAWAYPGPDRALVIPD